jgi:hypothetical protein
MNDSGNFPRCECSFPIGTKIAIGVQKRKNNDIRRREVIAM